MNVHVDPVEISAWLDGEQPVWKAGEIALHLERCDACRHAATRLRATIAELQELPAPEPPAQLIRTVLSQVTAFSPYRRAAIAACLLFGLTTLFGGAVLVGWGMLTGPVVEPDVAVEATAWTTAALRLLHSAALVARIGWNLVAVLLDSVATVTVQQGGALVPLILLALAGGLGFALHRSLQGYHRKRMA